MANKHYSEIAKAADVILLQNGDIIYKRHLKDKAHFRMMNEAKQMNTEDWISSARESKDTTFLHHSKVTEATQFFVKEFEAIAEALIFSIESAKELIKAFTSLDSDGFLISGFLTASWVTLCS